MSDESWLRRALLDNLGLKLTALVASITLFSLVRGSEDAQSSLAVEVSALLPSTTNERILVSETPEELRLTLRGSQSVLNLLRREGLPPMVMDLRDTSQRFYTFEPEQFQLPVGIQIVQIAPAAVQLTWDRRVERELDIFAVTRGVLPEGLSVVNLRTRPSRVRVVGPDSEAGRLRRLSTQEVDVSGLAVGRHERQVPLEELPLHTRVLGPLTVTVTFDVEPQEVERRFRNLEVAVVGAGDVEVRPANVDVRVRGPGPVVREITQARILPRVELRSDMSPQVGAQPAQVRVTGLPEGLEAFPEPAEVLVRARSSRPSSPSTEE
jgi:YbbR domain-containing protein